MLSLRDFIRQALDLEPIPTGLEIPMQGPARPGGGGSGRSEDRERGKGKEGGGTGGGGAMDLGLGMGGMAGLGLGHGTEEPTDEMEPTKGE
ncbi:hypothetical protein DES53_102248 [Roseimicrobium gellanilyticum]|uniref:Uncharacterized protein n=1 Tax=Roseimicrobium gellanilyticum TaxID=748857 RepID=A0A366HSF9_9BACT|nr:hypothetical protein [Roseimicrobium gellanilyticum]RBP45864.1 hypothetical protein DES53_102248 [Roseimicrobium gellanilyticum]